MTKYIFVTGGVVSSIGKGIIASSVGQLLKSRGLKVFMQKFDPYLNVDPGTMSPLQHGEVFVTNDGAETDLDLGHYERFIDENLNKHSNITSGKIYQSILKKEREGEYLGKTVQVVPHVTNQIKKKLLDVARHTTPDVVITEIGGTVGDIESEPFLEAIRQARRDFGFENTLYIHTTLLPFLKAANEIKTKPTQHSVKELRKLGIQPDIMVLRSEVPIDDGIKDKIALFCDVKKEAVFEALDVSVIYQIIINLYEQGIDKFILNHFNFPVSKSNITPWRNLIEKINNVTTTLNIALVGKYVAVHDAYLSINESLKHAGYKNDVKVNIIWIDSETVTDENVSTVLKDAQGILVPGGFGERATSGKISAIKYARTNNIPFFGICYGMQLAAVEFARNVLNLEDANSTEIDEFTKNPIIHILDNHTSDEAKGGTLRLGLYPCDILKNTKTYNAYKTASIAERHRHRYEFNNDYIDLFNKNGLIISGYNKNDNLVEILELKDHPFFIACQFHPEFLSRPLRPHPLFDSFIKASIKNN
ncbi:MAG: CTP synthase [Acholeplasmatales bacterium]|jgi:CTP synthase|nr:CTP synthase [Acholeplasmatales bacterium]